MSEEELAKHLRKTLTIIGLIILFLIIGMGFFAPKIGALFGFVSKHYWEEEKPAEILPVAPVFTNIPNATKDETVSIEGLSEPGMTIKLFVNGPEAKTTIADAEGKFTFTDITLIKGKNILFAKAVNSQNVESEKSESHEIGYDDKAPEITIEEPKNKSIIKNLDKRIMVRGKVNEKATVKINDRMAILKPDLTFELLLGVDEGNIEITITAVDEAGNEKSEKISVEYDQSSSKHQQTYTPIIKTLSEEKTMNLQTASV